MIFGEALKKYQITMIAVVPPVVLLMAKHPAFDKFDFSVRFYSLFIPLYGFLFNYLVI